MRIEEKIGMISAIIIAFLIVVFVINQEYILDYSLDNMSDQVCTSQCSVNILNGFSPINLLFEIPIVSVIAVIVWHFTTKSENKNRKYIRGKIVNQYLKCLTVSGALMSVPSHRTNIQDLTNIISQHFQEIIKRSTRHSHLLNGEEIDNFINEQSIFDSIFKNQLIKNPDDDELLKEFYDYLRRVLSNYIKKHKLKKFNEYVIVE